MRAVPFVLLGLFVGLAFSYFQHRGARDADVAEPTAPREIASAAEPQAREARQTNTELLNPGVAPTPLLDPSVKVKLDEIVARLEAIETKLDSLDRRPVGGTKSYGSADDPELRSLVMAVLDEAAAADEVREVEHDRMAEQEAKKKRKAELRFHVGMMLAEIKDEIPLNDGEKEAVIAAVIEMEERRVELQRFDPATTDPEVFQREFEAVEEDFWRRLETDLGIDVAARLREHF